MDSPIPNTFTLSLDEITEDIGNHKLETCHLNCKLSLITEKRTKVIVTSSRSEYKIRAVCFMDGIMQSMTCCQDVP